MEFSVLVNIYRRYSIFVFQCEFMPGSSFIQLLTNPLGTLLRFISQKSLEIVRGEYLNDLLLTK